MYIFNKTHSETSAKISETNSILGPFKLCGDEKMQKIDIDTTDKITNQ